MLLAGRRVGNAIASARVEAMGALPLDQCQILEFCKS